MIANPHPDEVFAIFIGECSMHKPYADGPKPADPLEPERWVSWVFLEKPEIPSRNSLDWFRKPIETPPKTGCRPVHLEFFERALFFGFHDFSNQEIQLPIS